MSRRRGRVSAPPRRLWFLDANLNTSQRLFLAQEEGVIPRPKTRIDKALARRLWPDLIMHPQPVSDVKPCESMNWLLNRTLRVIDGAPSRPSCLGIGGKLDRYVIQILDSKSVRNDSGQPWALLDSAASRDGPLSFDVGGSRSCQYGRGSLVLN